MIFIENHFAKNELKIQREPLTGGFSFFTEDCCGRTHEYKIRSAVIIFAHRTFFQVPDNLVFVGEVEEKAGLFLALPYKIVC